MIVLEIGLIISVLLNSRHRIVHRLLYRIARRLLWKRVPFKPLKSHKRKFSFIFVDAIEHI